MTAKNSKNKEAENANVFNNDADCASGETEKTLNDVNSSRADVACASDEAEKNSAEINGAPEISGAPAKEQNLSSEEACGFCVYLGPSILGVISCGTVYNAGKNATLTNIADIVKKYPLVADLIVSGDKLPESRVKVKTPGNLLYVNSRKLAEGLRKQGGKTNV